MAVSPDIDTFISPSQPIVARLYSDQAVPCPAEIRLTVDGVARSFRIGPTVGGATSESAESHAVSVAPYFGTKLFLFEWGTGTVGGKVKLSANAAGTVMVDEGVIF